MTILLEITSMDTDESRATGIKRWTPDGKMTPVGVVSAGKFVQVSVWKGANIFLEEIDAKDADLYVSDFKAAREAVRPTIEREAENEKRRPSDIRLD